MLKKQLQEKIPKKKNNSREKKKVHWVVLVGTCVVYASNSLAVTAKFVGSINDTAN